MAATPRILSVLLVVSAVVSGCDPSEPGYPVDGPSYLGVADGTFPASADEMVADADVIAVVRPTGGSREVWNQLGTFVSSRFTVEVTTVLKGSLQRGDRFELYAPGGHVQDPFEATSSRKPADGRGTLEQFVDWPFFAKGREELVFLKLVTPDPALEKPFYYNLGPSARYRVEDGKLGSIYPAAADVDDPGDVRKSLVGISLTELQAIIRSQQ